MGKLYDLVEFRNYLIDQFDNFSLDNSIRVKFDLFEKTKKIFPQYENYIDTKIKEYLDIQEKNQQFLDSINHQISILNTEIDNMAIKIFSSKEYLNFFHEDQIQEPMFNKKLIISTELETIISAKITEYSDWHYPALQINPRNKKWIDYMVAADPLYLTHSVIDVVSTLITSFPGLYQNRLRLYEIKDRNFSKLPYEQFSFVLCWDYFNYLSMEKIEKYIREVWLLLRPGGRFIFSYTNGDLVGSVLQAESLSCAYSNSRWMKSLCQNIGYEISSFNDYVTGDALNTHVSWIEIKKPGQLKTIKLAQSMAQIIPK
jgi:hypothetical protein